MNSQIPGGLLTTAMAVMPHTDVDRALETALTLDVPFWPQLPNYSYHEDMYVQAAEHFPGIVLDLDMASAKIPALDRDRRVDAIHPEMTKPLAHRVPPNEVP